MRKLSACRASNVMLCSPATPTNVKMDQWIVFIQQKIIKWLHETCIQTSSKHISFLLSSGVRIKWHKPHLQRTSRVPPAAPWSPSGGSARRSCDRARRGSWRRSASSARPRSPGQVTLHVTATRPTLSRDSRDLVYFLQRLATFLHPFKHFHVIIC